MAKAIPAQNDNLLFFLLHIKVEILLSLLINKSNKLKIMNNSMTQNKNNYYEIQSLFER